MNNYYCITTTYETGKPVIAEYTDVRHSMRCRPAATSHTEGSKTIYNDWYLAEELMDEFPEIAEKYGF